MGINNESYTIVQCTYNNGEGFWTVDAWRKQEEEEQGKVVAVINDKTADVYFIEPEARISPMAMKTIKEKVGEIRNIQGQVQTYTLFGKEAVRIYLDYMDGKKGKKTEEAVKAILTKDFQTQHRTFTSEGEKTAYYSGMEDYDGWMDFVHISKDDYDLIDSVQERNK